jgi:cell division protein ZapB
MLRDLTSFETKLDQVLVAHQAMRAENQGLRVRVATLEAEKRRLEEKIEAAASRLEALLAKLPEPAEPEVQP